MRRLTAALLVSLALVAHVTAPAQASPPEVSAEGAVLWDPHDDRVLWGSNETTPLPPASTTKIMTVLLALEAGTIEDTVTVSEKAAAIGRQPGAATLYLDAGERIAMRSLLSGLILRSGNDAAVAVAEHVAGTEDAFVVQMNARAAELGLRDTSFINASGLTDDLEHHASALDLARLAEVALRDDDFAEWAGASTLTIPSIGAVVSRNELLGVYPGANGVKTGYTALAGLCLVASAERGHRRLIAVVLNSEASFTDSSAILDHGFDDFHRPQPARPGRAATTYRWTGAAVAAVPSEKLAITVARRRPALWRTVLLPAVTLPVAEGAPLGRADLVVGDRVVDTTPLLADEAVQAPADAAGAGGAVADALRAFARLHVADRDL